MKEHVEKIIEIILENVSCTHQLIEEHPRGPRHYDPTYNLDDEKAVIEKCLKVLPGKPGLTEQFLSDKAKLFVYAIMPSDIEPTRSDIHAAKEFLRSLFEEEK